MTKKAKKKIPKGSVELPTVDLIGSFEKEDRTIQLDSYGRIIIKRPDRAKINIYVDQKGDIVIMGEDAITIRPGASNCIRIL